MLLVTLPPRTAQDRGCSALWTSRGTRSQVHSSKAARWPPPAQLDLLQPLAFVGRVGRPRMTTFGWGLPLGYLYRAPN